MKKNQRFFRIEELTHGNKKKIDRNKEEEENRIQHNVEAKMDHVRGIFRPEYIKKK